LATTPQRRWQAACPNCGAPVEFRSGASGTAVCSFCRSTLVREGDALRRIGQSAELFEDYSPLQLGAAGHHAGEAFALVGRLQIGYAGGSWNEWHALFDNGRSAWLSEDNGRFVMSFEALLEERVPAPTAFVIGAPLTVAGQRWQVGAVTQAQVAAAQGELPRPPAGGFVVVELRNAQDEVGSLEFVGEAPPLWSVGRQVRIEELGMSGLREDSSKTLGSRSLPCPSCGAPLEPRLDSSKSITCEHCHAVVDLTQKDEGAALAYFAQHAGPEPRIALGTQGTLPLDLGGKPVDWQVVGYQERREIGDDEPSSWREYLLFNRTEGFAFLVDTDEGWSLVRPLTGAPTDLGETAVWQSKRFAHRWTYQAETTRVLGEFYWRLERGERAEVSDYELRGTGRSELLSREQMSGEVVWSLGRTLSAAEVAAAFGLAAGAAGALSHPDVQPSAGLLRTIIIVVVVLLVLMLLLRACTHDDCQAYRDNFGPNSAEYMACKARNNPRIVPIGSGAGGSWGGFGSGGGGHK